MQIREGQWTPEVVATFWAYKARRTDLAYFTSENGLGVAHFLDYTGRLQPGATLLDYGCGPGFLIEHLLKRRIDCYGTDFSPGVVERTNRKYAGDPHWKGAFVLDGSPRSLPVARFDVVTCIETLEHLPDDSLQQVPRDIFEALKPGGIAMFSTPFNENLKLGNIFCPFCRTEFHKVQHQRSFDAAQLSSLLQSQGFTVLFCRDLNFQYFQRPVGSWKTASVRSLAWGIRKRLMTGMDRISARAFPNGRAFTMQLRPGSNLCAVVERPM